MSHKRDSGKQCRPRSDTTECGIWSGSTLFAVNTWISIKMILIIKINIDTLSTGNGLVQRVEVEESTWHKWIKIYSAADLLLQSGFFYPESWTNPFNIYWDVLQLCRCCTVKPTFNPYTANHNNCRLLCHLLVIFLQTVWTQIKPPGAVWSGSMLFAFMQK